MTERDFAAIAAQRRARGATPDRAIPRGQRAQRACCPILHAFQNVEGWVSPEALAQAARWTDVPLSVVESTASFYTLFHRRPIGRYMLQPCRNLSCIVNGAGAVMRRFRERLGHRASANDERRNVLVRRSRVSRRVRSRAVHAGQSRIRLRPHRGEGRRDAAGDARRHVSTFRRSRSRATPGSNWQVGQDGRKSPGAQDVSSPNDPGGLGDASGVRMIERLETNPYPIDVRPTRERLVNEGAARLTSPTTSKRALAPMPVVNVLTEGIGEARPARPRDVSRTRRIRAMAPRRHRDAARRHRRRHAAQRSARARRRGISDRTQVVVPAEQRPAALHGLQLRRGRTRHVQGSHAPRGDAASGPRGHS